eukprot:7380058-Pyramimonas_sp.AAC.1
MPGERRRARREVGDKVHYWSEKYGKLIVAKVAALPAARALGLNIKRRVPEGQVQDVDVARLRAEFDR